MKCMIVGLGIKVCMCVFGVCVCECVWVCVSVCETQELIMYIRASVCVLGREKMSVCVRERVRNWVWISACVCASKRILIVNLDGCLHASVIHSGLWISLCRQLQIFRIALSQLVRRLDCEKFRLFVESNRKWNESRIRPMPSCQGFKQAYTVKLGYNELGC
jgi:hypothetical protein